MGRKDTLAAKSIRKMYEQLNLIFYLTVTLHLTVLLPDFTVITAVP